MRLVLPFQWGAAGKPQEDVLNFDEKLGIFLVADGITRTPGSSGYPDPSPAKLAADRFLETAMDVLRRGPSTEEGMREACRAGNQSVRDLNVELGLWDHCDYWENDFAGAVFAGLLLKDTNFVWGFMTDCGIVHLSSDGKILWMTEDRLAPVRQYFPPPPQTKERQISIRRDLRNRPSSGMDRTYGAFTGEEEALSYLEVGTRSFNAGDTLLVFTDGALPLVKNGEFRLLLCAGTTADIERFALDSAHRQHDGEKTLVAVRTM